MKRRYSLRWKLPHRPCPGPHELVSEVVGAGQPAPESVMARWVAGARYAVCVDFLMRDRSGAGAMNGKRLPADEIWSAALIGLRHCLLMNLSSGNWKPDRSIFAVNQPDKGWNPGQTVTVCGIIAVALEAFCLMT